MTTPLPPTRRGGGEAVAGSDEGHIPGLGAIVLAAGLGTRMRSRLAKVLHPVVGRPMILYTVALAERLAAGGVAVVVGYQADRVEEVITRHGSGPASPRSSPSRVVLVQQAQQLGTGHAVMQTRSAFSGRRGDRPSAYLIVNGDTPLLCETTVRQLWNRHQEEGATLTMVTAMLQDPSGYGRVVRDRSSRSVTRIVEDRDARGEETELREINVGTYLVDGRFLFEALEKLQPSNAQGEYYLTDLVGMAVERGLRVCPVTLEDSREGLGINSRADLAVAEELMRRKILAHWMEAGVTIHDPNTTWIGPDVVIGQDTVLYPNVTLEGATSVGEDCTIRSHCRLTDCVIGDRVAIQDCCVMRETTLEQDATVGPFAHLRPGAVVRRKGKVGNFVEMKQSELGQGSKANHLTYLGDARIGEGVNIGAGTVTCNYDGVSKHETVIEDGVFVGSDALLIAPVTLGRGSLVAAGSVVTEDVPEEGLAIGRSKQVNRPGWAARRRALSGTSGQKPKPKPEGKSKKAKGKSRE